MYSRATGLIPAYLEDLKLINSFYNSPVPNLVQGTYKSLFKERVAIMEEKLLFKDYVVITLFYGLITWLMLGIIDEFLFGWG